MTPQQQENEKQEKNTLIRYNVTLDTKLATKLDEYQENRGFISPTETIRCIIRETLFPDEEKKENRKIMKGYGRIMEDIGERLGETLPGRK